MQRQVNQTSYYTAQTWQQLDPWVRQYEVVPFVNSSRNVTSAAVLAATQTVDATSLRADGRFGYRDQAPANVWFYDYYTYTPAYYTGQSGDRYTGAVQYFDADSDGIYDSYSYYRDSDDDGRYDEYDRIDFHSKSPTGVNESNAQERIADASKPDNNPYQGPEDTQRYRIQGEITMLKAVEVNGNRYLMAGVKHAAVELLAVDLGLASEMNDRQIDFGQRIVAIGSMEKIGEKNVLIAESVQLGEGTTIEVSQGMGVTISDEIVDVKNTMIGEQDHYLAVVNVDGKRQLIDRGRTTTYRSKPEPLTQITVRGIPVRAPDHRVIMAERVHFGDEVFESNGIRLPNF